MKLHQRAIALFAAAAFSAVAFPLTASAEDWPARPVRLIVPFPAGGGTDIIARDLTHALTSAGYNFIVDNKPGSGGNMGVDAAAKSPADGYTFVLGQTSNLAINPSLYPKLPYNPEKDLTPVGLVASSPLVIVASAASPFKTLADVVAAARANPGSINYASSGNGTVSHLAAESFQKLAGVKFTHVPYKGAAQGVSDVISGQVQLYISTVPTLLGHIKSGKMRALAMTSLKRVAELPQVPTVSESGYKGFETSTWFGIAAPANVPKAIVTKLNADINKALKDPALQARLAEQGAEVITSTPEQFATLIHTDNARWARIVKESGARID